LDETRDDLDLKNEEINNWELVFMQNVIGMGRIIGDGRSMWKGLDQKCIITVFFKFGYTF